MSVDGEDHRFTDVAEDLQILVVFAPPDTPTPDRPAGVWSAEAQMPETAAAYTGTEAVWTTLPSRSRPCRGEPPAIGACTRQEPAARSTEIAVLDVGFVGREAGWRRWFAPHDVGVAAGLDQGCRTSWTANHRRSHRRVCRFRQQQLRSTRRGRARMKWSGVGTAARKSRWPSSRRASDGLDNMMAFASSSNRAAQSNPTPPGPSSSHRGCERRCHCQPLAHPVDGGAQAWHPVGSGTRVVCRHL